MNSENIYYYFCKSQNLCTMKHLRLIFKRPKIEVILNSQEQPRTTGKISMQTIDLVLKGWCQGPSPSTILFLTNGL